MTDEKAKHLKPSEFKRFYGVYRETFEQMGSILRQAEEKKPPARPSKFSVEDQLLMSLEF